MNTRETKVQAQEVAGYSLWQLVRYFLKLGALGFGGRVALVGYMHRYLVEKREWIVESDSIRASARRQPRRLNGSGEASAA